MRGKTGKTDFNHHLFWGLPVDAHKTGKTDDFGPGVTRARDFRLLQEGLVMGFLIKMV